MNCPNFFSRFLQFLSKSSISFKIFNFFQNIQFLSKYSISFKIFNFFQNIQFLSKSSIPFKIFKLFNPFKIFNFFKTFHSFSKVPKKRDKMGKYQTFLHTMGNRSSTRKSATKSSTRQQQTRNPSKNNNNNNNNNSNNNNNNNNNPTIQVNGRKLCTGDTCPDAAEYDGKTGCFVLNKRNKKMPNLCHHDEMVPTAQKEKENSSVVKVSASEVVCSCVNHEQGVEYANMVFKMGVDDLFQHVFNPTSSTMNTVFQNMNFTQVKYTQSDTQRDTQTHPPTDTQRDTQIDTKADTQTHTETVTETELTPTQTLSYIVPLNNPVGPKHCSTTTKHTMQKYNIPGRSYVVETETTSSGIPYADCFVIRGRYCLTKVSEDSCRLRIISDILFTEGVGGLIKDMIVKESDEGMRLYTKILLETLKEQCKNTQQTLRDTQQTDKDRQKTVKNDGSKAEQLLEKPAGEDESAESADSSDVWETVSTGEENNTKSVQPPSTTTGTSPLTDNQQQQQQHDRNIPLEVLCCVLICMMVCSSVYVYLCTVKLQEELVRRSHGEQPQQQQQQQQRQQ